MMNKHAKYYKKNYGCSKKSKKAWNLGRMVKNSPCYKNKTIAEMDIEIYERELNRIYGEYQIKDSKTAFNLLNSSTDKSVASINFPRPWVNSLRVSILYDDNSESNVARLDNNRKRISYYMFLSEYQSDRLKEMNEEFDGTNDAELAKELINFFYDEEDNLLEDVISCDEDW